MPDTLTVPPTPPTSLRERKKQNTRRTLVNAAVGLCTTHGYEHVTVEQIAAAADVSPRTFSRYFATKDAVFVAILDDLAAEVVSELAAQPPGPGPVEVLRIAHVAVLTRAAGQPLVGLSSEDISLMLRIVNSSHALRQAAIDYRSPAVVSVLAQRMGVSPHDPQLDLAVTIFSTVMVRVCRDVAAESADLERAPEAIMKRLDFTLGQVARFTADLDVHQNAM